MKKSIRLMAMGLIFLIFSAGTVHAKNFWEEVTDLVKPVIPPVIHKTIVKETANALSLGQIKRDEKKEDFYKPRKAFWMTSVLSSSFPVPCWMVRPV